MNQRGQTTLEYVALLAVVVGVFVAVSQFLKKADLAKRLSQPITQEYRRAYQFGNPQAKGLDTEEIELHPRVVTGNNFRIFINPE